MSLYLTTQFFTGWMSFLVPNKLSKH